MLQDIGVCNTASLLFSVAASRLRLAVPCQGAFPWKLGAPKGNPGSVRDPLGAMRALLAGSAVPNFVPTLDKKP